MAELSHAGMLPRANAAEEYGYVGRLELSRPPELPESVLIIEGITTPCGTADSVYLYDYSGGPERRILESRGVSERDETVISAYFSSLDDSGNRLFLALRHATQCGSSWNNLSYELFRLSPGAILATTILSGDDGIRSGVHDAYRVQLKPDEVLIELRGRSMDPRVRDRTHVLRFRIGPSAAVRIDPVALQPQDFVDEWLTRPWMEMASRSSAADLDELERWHGFLSGDSDTAEIRVVQPCADKPVDWKIALTMEWISGKKMPEPFTLYFRVHGLGQYRFEMAAISFHPQDGCPGETPPIPGSPSFFDMTPLNK